MEIYNWLHHVRTLKQKSKRKPPFDSQIPSKTKSNARLYSDAADTRRVELEKRRVIGRIPGRWKISARARDAKRFFRPPVVVCISLSSIAENQIKPLPPLKKSLGDLLASGKKIVYSDFVWM